MNEKRPDRGAHAVERKRYLAMAGELMRSMASWVRWVSSVAR